MNLSYLFRNAPIIKSVLGLQSIPVIGRNVTLIGDSLTQRQFDTLAGNQLNASAGTATLTLSADREWQLPGNMIRLVSSVFVDSPLGREKIVLTHPTVRAITYDAGANTATAEAWAVSFGNFPCAEGYFNHCQGVLRQRLNLLKNLGTDGERTDQILARMNQIPGNTNILIVCAGANDLLQGISQATIIANLSAIMDSAITKADKVIVITPTPLQAGGSVAPALRDHIVSYAADKPKIAVLDAYALVVADGLQTPKSGYLIDSVHWSPNAAWAIGNGVAAIIDSFISSAAVTPGGTNKLTNGNFAAVTGNLANGVTVTPSGQHTVTNSIVANPNGNGNLQRISLTSTSTSGTTRAQLASVHAALTVGKRYRLWTRIRVGATTNMTDIQMMMILQDASRTYNIRAYDTATGSGMGGTKRNYLVQPDLYVRSEWFVCPSGLTSAVARIGITMAAAVGSAVVDFGEVFLEEEA